MYIFIYITTIACCDHEILNNNCEDSMRAYTNMKEKIKIKFSVGNMQYFRLMSDRLVDGVYELSKPCHNVHMNS